MQSTLDNIRDTQKQLWNKFSPGWQKWHQFTEEFTHKVTETMIHDLQLKKTDTVLDIAGGTGDPALKIAAIVTEGNVICTDQAEGMLAIAKKKAEDRKIKNFTTQLAGVSNLPFEDATFNAVSCRYGFMFFPDMTLAAQEMARVLKPGGHLTTAVWDGPQKNYWITVTMDTIKKYLPIEPPAPGAPGIFRCAEEGAMKKIFTGAGLKNITETQVTIILNAGTAETYWDYIYEIAAPVSMALSKTDKDTKDKIKDQVINKVNEKFGKGKVNIPASTIVVSGEK
ncbi:MAG: class I SAM-dependent methyltransferase [Ginsengibacter sp.]